MGSCPGHGTSSVRTRTVYESDFLPGVPDFPGTFNPSYGILNQISRARMDNHPLGDRHKRLESSSGAMRMGFSLGLRV